MNKKKILKVILIACIVLAFVVPIFFNKIYFRIIYKVTVPKEADATARSIIKYSQHYDYQGVKKIFSDETLKKNSKEKILCLMKYIKDNVNSEPELIGYNILSEDGIKRSELTYETRFNQKWAFINCIVISDSKTNKVRDINIQPIEKSIKDVNAFNMKGKPINEYIFLGLGILIAGFNIYALIKCIKSNINKKWLWVIISIFGICGFTLNWTTGQMQFTYILVNIPCFAFYKNGIYAPWLFTINIPLGSVIFLLKRKKLILSYKKSLEVGKQAV